MASVFYNIDEKIYLNSLTDEMRRDGTITKEKLLSEIKLNRAMIDLYHEFVPSEPADPDKIVLVEEVYEKIKALSDEQWEDLMEQIPFWVPVTPDD